jgi:hypothetical protein
MRVVLAFFLSFVFMAAACPAASFATEPTSGTGNADWTAGLTGLGHFRLTDRGRELLGKNGFFIQPTDEADIADIYGDARTRGQGQFVTTDAMLHAGHILFDYLLRLLEVDQLSTMAEALTDRMLALSTDQYRTARDPDLKEAARLNIGFFAVAKMQFSPGYRAGHGLEGVVSREITNIAEHKGFEFRRLLTYVKNPSLDETPFAFEDYSQYVPRGHYTRNERFQNYFRAMMWYGRVDFKILGFTRDGKPSEIGRKMTLQALLMTEALAHDQEAMGLWRKIYEPTVYFVGKSDDLTVLDYAALAREVFPGSGLARLADRKCQTEFMKRAKELRPPTILSGAGSNAAETLGFRFMGQRFIPDSHIFQELVYGASGFGGTKPHFPFTGTGKPFTMEFIDGVGNTRAFPRALDVMAVLGSRRALELLRRDGDTAYGDYDGQFAALSRLYGSTTPEQWRQNLYWRWLHALLPLLEERTPGGAQPFLRTSAWRDKSLQTALGSWVELRHDTILYAKQSYTGMSKCAMTWEEGVGFVEPEPEVYERLATMFGDLRTNLVTLGLATEGIPQKLEEFEKTLLRLRDISRKELASQPLSNMDYAFIANFDQVLRSLPRFPPHLMQRITSGTDSRMEVIADVHTDAAGSKSVLEEAIGSPAAIDVLVRDDRGYRICRGGVFSYYEFKHPMGDRLTDEKWQQMGRESRRPQQPPWVKELSE